MLLNWGGKACASDLSKYCPRKACRACTSAAEVRAQLPVLTFCVLCDPRRIDQITCTVLFVSYTLCTIVIFLVPAIMQ